MLRELVDTAFLEDYLGGLGRASGRRICAYDRTGALIAVSPAVTEYARLANYQPPTLPPTLHLIRLPADAPPASIGFVERGGVWFVIAPIHLQDEFAGYIGVGEFRDAPPDSDPTALLAYVEPAHAARLRAAWQDLPELDRAGSSPAVSLARWAARMLADSCQREQRAHAAAEELSLIGDIARLLSGEQQLQQILDSIVLETARVMKCRFCSLRLYNRQTGELTLKAVHNLSKRYLRKGVIRRLENPIDDEALNGHMVYVEDARNDPRIRFPEEARTEGIVSGLTCGMIYRGTPVGVLRVYTDRKQRFRRVHHNLLRAVATHAAVAIVHAQLAEERLRSAETDRQLAVAGNVQARMIRPPPANYPGVRAAIIYDPTSHVGGDFCDFVTIGDGRLVAVVADVAGKGIPASLLMASVQGALRASAEFCDDLGELIGRLNRHVYRETSPGTFVTLLSVALDIQRREIAYCNAGHDPLLLRRGEELIRPEAAGLVLGVDPGEVYREEVVPIELGDFILLATDGASEAINFEGGLFGRQRLHDSVLRHGALDPQDALRNIHWDIRRFVGLAEQSDDLTLVGLKFVTR